MPSIKKKNVIEQEEYYYDYNEDNKLTLEDYLNNEKTKQQLISNHYNTFSLKYENVIKDIYERYYNRYKYTGFLEKDESCLGYYDIYNILYDRIKILYDIDIFTDN